MVVHAVLALLWRRVLLGEVYGGTGFYDVTEPTPLIFIQGLSFYLLTGLLLTLLFAHILVAKGSASPVRFSIITGVLYWVVHDYSYIGRRDVVDAGLYLLLQAVLVALVFTAYGLLLGMLFKRDPAETG